MKARPDTANKDKLCILTLDDEPSIREVYRLGLTQAGHEVVPAATGREALQLMMQHRFDVLIVDIRMREMSGIVFLQEALKIWPWVGVVIVSGHITTSVTEQARALGVTRVMHKPVSLRDLIANVTEAARDRPAAADELTGSRPLALMKDHLKLLSRLDETTSGSGTLIDALHDFGRDLASMLPCDMLGLLVAERESNAFIVHLRNPVCEAFVHEVQDEMLARYRVVSGHGLAASQIETKIEGAEIEPNAPGCVGTTLSVPIILGNDVCGMLTLATHANAPYNAADVSLLYHAANHMAAVFLALRRMQHLATRDGLTGLFNRMRIEEELEQTWQVTHRYGPSMAVVVIDIDHFKVMNDTYGHAVGDEVLRAFSDLMRQAARSSDMLARYGGDEFLAILPRAAVADAQIFCERLLERTRTHVFCSESHRLNVTISVGIATSDNPSHLSSGAELLAQADKALYMAKRGGRDRICVWQGDKAAAEAAASGDKPDDTDVIFAEKTRARIVVVDDEEPILRFLSTLLKQDGYDVTTFSSAGDAVAAVKAAPHVHDVILTDISMPGMTGLELLKKISDADGLIVKIVMTGYATVDNAVSCLREGAFDFIQKPIESRHFAAVMRRAMDYRSLKLENARHQSHLERMVEQRSSQLLRTLEDVKASYEFSLEAFMAILDAREHQTGRHSLRVRELAIWLARKMDIRGKSLDEIATGAMLHDIGKIAIPDRVLFNTGPLNPEDWRVMQTHADLGHKILSGSAHLAGAARIVEEHHERYDGQGYPKGLKGEQICLGARIFAVVDAYDAMRSNRMYRPAISTEAAVTEVATHRGTQFDPDVCDIFLRHQDEIEQLYQRLSRERPPLPTVPTE